MEQSGAVVLRHRLLCRHPLDWNHRQHRRTPALLLLVVAVDFLDLILPLFNIEKPHMAEEIWERLGHAGSIFDGANWPEFDVAKLVETTVNVAIQVNGKLRATISIEKNERESEVIAAARAEENVMRHIEGKEERRVIHVPGRLVNFVVG